MSELFILISNNPSLFTEKPLFELSNCIDETPQSIKAPSILFNKFSSNSLSKSENLPCNGIILSLKLNFKIIINISKISQFLLLLTDI